MKDYRKKFEQQQQKEVCTEKREKNTHTIPKRCKAEKFGIGIKQGEENSCHHDTQRQIDVKESESALVAQKSIPDAIGKEERGGNKENVQDKDHSSWQIGEFL
jgi:hypothetical protein